MVEVNYVSVENCKSAFGSEYDEKTMICAAAKGKGVIQTILFFR
jgi:hypothetical protein